ncbi:glucose-methanol-choline oxidoreductase [Crucibulum laeve]|uniref:Glucose-methanol-choline oxidoreductase n=1 Tax=Crucibulum laeve TaxID=68775 RepID=A0A5C3LZG1_9AGAR|nr:glucose-methanol-choline oxidoreductase [Crucibulum laeve]
MSARDANYGVVDPDLLVKGVEGLRIVDASILPIVPAAHTQAATYAIAERAADLIKETWRH